MESSQIARITHIIVETVVFVCMFFMFNKQNSELSLRLEKTESSLNEVMNQLLQTQKFIQKLVNENEIMKHKLNSLTIPQKVVNNVNETEIKNEEIIKPHIVSAILTSFPRVDSITRNIVPDRVEIIPEPIVLEDHHEINEIDITNELNELKDT